MVATLDLVRFPLGVAQLELWRAQRRRDEFHGAAFSSLLLPVALRYMPLPVGQLRTFGYLAVWPTADAAERFRASALARRWDRTARHLELTLQPIQSFGSWRGVDPIEGTRGEAGPGPVLLITHSRTRLSKLAPFARASGRVADSLPRQPGHLWADGFADRLRTLDTGTLSLWRSAADATHFAYNAGIHRDAVQAERDGRWFAESWFGRFGVISASGDWPGIEIDALGPG
ncbi:MAG TPA: hypothetical protein VNP96_12555 [Solirubrobacterales bacterium]|nr:hypothetical protein [Solirubrobacterales bacterium]